MHRNTRKWTTCGSSTPQLRQPVKFGVSSAPHVLTVTWNTPVTPIVLLESGAPAAEQTVLGCVLAEADPPATPSTAATANAATPMRVIKAFPPDIPIISVSPASDRSLSQELNRSDGG